MTQDARSDSCHKCLGRGWVIGPIEFNVLTRTFRRMKKPCPNPKCPVPKPTLGQMLRDEHPRFRRDVGTEEGRE